MKFFNTDRHTLLVFLISLITVTLPFRKLNATVMVSTVIFAVIFSGEVGWKKVIALSKTPVFYILITPFILSILGFLATQNFKAGFQRIETELPLIYFPLLFGCVRLRDGDKSFIISVFLMSILAYCLISEIEVIYRYWHNVTSGVHRNWIKFFFHKLYTHQRLISLLQIHPSYFGFYVSFANLILINQVRLHWASKPVRAIAYTCVILFQTFFLFQLTAILPLVLNIVLLSFFVVLIFATTRIYLAQRVVIALVAAIVLAVMSTFVHRPLQRIKSKINETSSFNQSESRRAIWTSAFRVIKDNWLFGVGTGDTDEVMRQQYFIDGFSYLREGNYNVHNQFLYYWITFGLLGLAAFIWFLSFGISRALVTKDLVLGLFIFSTVTFMIIENVLAVQRGVVFISFWYSLMIYNSGNSLRPLETLHGFRFFYRSSSKGIKSTIKINRDHTS